ncbi:unnamed protein product [Eruca vesicaria subsp. sativa]|uniref:Uncharacterized protein n=1 Tax=Eruca vesicaria subsp. sativa TaxID=29727 RepID=A0ABC8JS54_ERUVS|nr:unnamed protein product [Eruca vesicaria subsp. sativa]
MAMKAVKSCGILSVWAAKNTPPSMDPSDRVCPLLLYHSVSVLWRYIFDNNHQSLQNLRFQHASTGVVDVFFTESLSKVGGGKIRLRSLMLSSAKNRPGTSLEDVEASVMKCLKQNKNFILIISYGGW